MASVLYLVIMFMVVYAMMGSNNNHLRHCEAASAKDLSFECVRMLIDIEHQLIDRPPANPFGGPFGNGPNPNKLPQVNFPLRPMRTYCHHVPKTSLSGLDLDLCRCKAKDLFGHKIGDNKEESSTLKVLNALDRHYNLSKSCGFDKDCDTAFQSVLTPCEAEAREAMKTCEPMLRAAAEGDLGVRARRDCCSLFQVSRFECACSSYTRAKDEITADTIRLNDFLHYLNDTLHDECHLSRISDMLERVPFYEGTTAAAACNLVKPDNSRDYKLGRCYFTDLMNMRLCGPTLRKPRMQSSELAVAALPLINGFSGCCSDRDWCKCDPRSISCCQKLGKLSKNGRDSCMCKLLNSNTTPDSTLDFLNFVRRNNFQISSCRRISPVYTDTCAALPPPGSYIHISYDRPEANKQRGWRTFDNPNP